MISQMLRNTFQIEFIQTPYFQTLLKELVQRFETIAKKPHQIYKVISMCIHALQDITPQLIDDSLKKVAANADSKLKMDSVYRKTSNLEMKDSALLDQVKLHLLVNHKRDFTRKSIITAIVVTAHGLNTQQIKYILTEYQ